MAALPGFHTPGFAVKTDTQADEEEVRESSARKGNSASYSTPLLCPRTPISSRPSVCEDSLPTTYGKRQRDLSDSVPSKRFHEDGTNPKLCVELFKVEGKVLFPCYLEETILKSKNCPPFQHDESDFEVYESDEETVSYSQSILCSQLEKSIQDELDSHHCI